MLSSREMRLALCRTAWWSGQPLLDDVQAAVGKSTQHVGLTGVARMALGGLGGVGGGDARGGYVWTSYA